MTKYYDHVSHMKVKIGELKTHLSKYLRQIERSGEPVEVCVREDTVAYLTPKRTLDSTGLQKQKLAQQLHAAGIQVSQWGSQADRGSCARSGYQGSCENPAEGPNSVESIRRERNW
jgi:antitoxin (DNA-binding transcriptional repressor) of toxin-antitoxin stability system